MTQYLSGVEICNSMYTPPWKCADATLGSPTAPAAVQEERPV